MDKAEFVQEAPIYYALAIAAELIDQGKTVSKFAIRKKYTINDETEHEGYYGLLDYDVLWDAGISWLLERNMIRIIKGSFGPPLFVETDDFARQWEDLSRERSPFTVYAAIDEKWDWLVSSLYEVNNTYHSLGITPEDFTNPTDEWEPIKLDTTQQSYEDAVIQLSLAVKKIREDNGYAVAFPDERDFVVRGLEGTIEKLESGTVTAGYIRDAFERLKLVGRRFQGAALGLVITGAQQAIIEFVKQQGCALLRSLAKLISGG